MWWIIAGLIVILFAGIIWIPRPRECSEGVCVSKRTRLELISDYVLWFLSGIFLGYGLCVLFDLSFAWLLLLIPGSLVGASVLLLLSQRLFVRLASLKKDK